MPSFRSRARFTREDLPARHVEDGVLLADEQFKVRAMPFAHHDIVSLGFSFEESMHINVWKNRLEEKRLPSGPWPGRPAWAMPSRSISPRDIVGTRRNIAPSSNPE